MIVNVKTALTQENIGQQQSSQESLAGVMIAQEVVMLDEQTEGTNDKSFTVRAEDPSNVMQGEVQRVSQEFGDYNEEKG